MKTENLQALQKCLICEMSKITKSYQSDFIIDMYAMQRENEAGNLVGKGYVMFRESGTEFSLKRDDVRIVYFKKEFPNSVIYEIDFDKLAGLDMGIASHYSILLESKLTFEEKFWCIKKIN
jgi:hypothetical protein